jgi:quinohemoprotein ethanol dehydrogenase
MAPSPLGAHNWLPMAFSPKTNLVYIPTISLEVTFTDKGIDPSTWHRTPYYSFDGGVGMAMPSGSAVGISSLVAWNPITQKQVWRVPKAATVSAGVVATAGNLVFQGDIDSSFSAFDATSGKLVWSFDAKAPVMAPPISYEVEGKQYVTVLTGAGSSLLAVSDKLKAYKIDYRTQKRRVLTFALDGTMQLPNSPVYEFTPIEDADYHADPAAEGKGAAGYGPVCLNCHGNNGIPAGLAPDLRASPAILSQDAFDSILNGALVEHGMPLFDRMPEDTKVAIRQYVRKLAHDAVVERQKNSGKYLGN